MATEREFDALASEAIASSEKEFFADAMDAGDPVADETGDQSLEGMGEGLEGQHEADDERDGDEPEGDKDEKGEHALDEPVAHKRDDQGRFKKPETPAERGLRNELTSEREKRKVVESEAAAYKAETERRFAALEARQAPPAPQPPAAQTDAKKDDAPDRWTDPEGYDRWLTDQVLSKVRADFQARDQRVVARSFEEAKAKHGDAFVEAYRAIDALPAADPTTKQLLESIMQSANPGERLVALHRQQLAAREIGNDPVAYREKVAAETREALMKDPEFRKAVMENLQGETRAPTDGSPRTITRLPPSLNSARGGALSRSNAIGGSDAELLAEVMG